VSSELGGDWKIRTREFGEEGGFVFVQKIMKDHSGDMVLLFLVYIAVGNLYV